MDRINSLGDDGWRTTVESAFRDGRAVAVSSTSQDNVDGALGTIGEYLSAQSVESKSFPGRGLTADRQTCWVASTGLGGPLHTRFDDVPAIDGDEADGLRGIEALRHADVRAALAVIKDEIDRALGIAVRGIHLDEDLGPEILERMTIRYRAIRYVAVSQGAEVAIHPDASAVSALITNRPGLALVHGWREVTRPGPGEGTILLPGATLAGWSGGVFSPALHGVSGDRGKVTVVGFCNWQNGASIPRSPRWTDCAEPFHNDMVACRQENHRHDGNYGVYWRRGLVVEGSEGTPRILTLRELNSAPTP